MLPDSSLTLLHFSDIHLPYPPGALRTPAVLHPKRLLALVNYWLRRSSKYADGIAKLHALAAFLRENPVDWILYTGDSVNLGLAREFVAAAPQLDAILTLARSGAVAIPGNHDLYTPRSVAQCDQWLPYGRSSDLPPAAAPAPWPLVRFLAPGIAAVAINTSRPNFAFWNSSGDLPDDQLSSLAELLDSPEIAACRHVLLLSHYPLDETGFFHGLRRASRIAEVLAQHPNLRILHGHNHSAYVRTLPGTSIPLYCAGSLTKAGAESFWLYRPVGDSLNPARAVYRNARWTLLDAPTPES